MSKHYFHESSDKLGEYHRIIYCEWCGVVVWNFNSIKETLKELQLNAQTSCKANTNKKDTHNE